MRYLVAILLVLAFIGVGSAAYAGNGSSRIIEDSGAYRIYEVTLNTGTTGHVDVVIPHINGLFWAAYYNKGTLTGNATVWVNRTLPYAAVPAWQNMTAGNNVDTMPSKYLWVGDMNIRLQGTGVGSQTGYVYILLEK